MKFIQYDGTGEVLSQIHNYLSTNQQGRDLRGLEKNSPALVAKARPIGMCLTRNKAQDQKKREGAAQGSSTSIGFLRPQDQRIAPEVLRRFPRCLGRWRHATIIGIANKLLKKRCSKRTKSC